MPEECAPAVCSLKRSSRFLTGVVKNGSFKGLRDLKKKISLANDCIFVFSWYKCFQRHFFWQWKFFVVGVWNLKGCVFVYVPTVSGHKFSVKGALGVGGGGEEWLKPYTCVRTGDDVVL